MYRLLRYIGILAIAFGSTRASAAPPLRIQRATSIINRLVYFTVATDEHDEQPYLLVKKLIGDESDPDVLSQVAVMAAVLVGGAERDGKNFQYMEAAVWACMRRVAETAGHESDLALLHFRQKVSLDAGWALSYSELIERRTRLFPSTPDWVRRLSFLSRRSEAVERRAR